MAPPPAAFSCVCLWIGSTPCGQFFLAGCLRALHHQHLGVYKLSPGFTFIAPHRSFLGPPCKDYHPDTCFLSSAALQHHGRRFHDFLNLSCLQIQYHVQDTTIFFSATCLGWRLATLDHSCSSFSMLELVGKCPRKLLSRRRKLPRLSPFPG